MTSPKCPQCKKPAEQRAQNKAFPFCCQRCQDVDLGKWLGGNYVVSRPLFNLPPELAMPPMDEDED